MRNSLTCESSSKLLCSSTRSTRARAFSQEISRRHSSAQGHERASISSYFFALSNSFRQLPPVLLPATHLCCSLDHQGTGFTKQGTEIQPQRRRQIGRASWDLFVGASSVICPPPSLQMHIVLSIILGTEVSQQQLQITKDFL